MKHQPSLPRRLLGLVIVGFLVFTTAPVGLLMAVAYLLTLYVCPELFLKKIADWLLSSYIRVVLFFYCCCVRIHWSGERDVLLGSESAVLMCNHQCANDWFVANLAGWYRGGMRNIQYVMKDMIKSVSYVGMTLHLRRGIFINRERYNSTKFAEHLKRLIPPTWLLIYPEGTRYNKANVGTFEANKEYAEKSNLPQFEHVLTPRYKAVLDSIDAIEDVAAVYDFTIAYSFLGDHTLDVRPNTPSLLDLFCGNVVEVHIDVSRLPIKDVPREGDECLTWLVGRFARKDELLKYFYSNSRRRFPDSREDVVSLAGFIPDVALWACVGLLFLSSWYGIAALSLGAVFSPVLSYFVP